MEPTEYLGGLCDLTGELGRVAVASGTRRNSGTVAKILETDLAIANALAQVVCVYARAFERKCPRAGIADTNAAPVLSGEAYHIAKRQTRACLSVCPCCFLESIEMIFRGHGDDPKSPRR